MMEKMTSSKDYIRENIVNKILGNQKIMNGFDEL